MKKKQRPTVSQYCYLMNSLLTACIERNGTITETDVRQAVETSIMANDMLMEAINAEGDEEPDEPPTDHFANYTGQWPARYTDLMAWLKEQGVSSKRRQAELLTEAIAAGFITKDSLTGKYHHTSTP